MELGKSSVKIAVVGNGGLGGYLAGQLAAAGYTTTLLVRSGFDELVKNGLRLTTVIGDVPTQALQIAPISKFPAGVEIVFVATKCWDVATVADQIPAEFSGYLISLQNGLYSDLVVKRLRPELNVLPGVAYIASKRTALCSILQTGGPCRFIFGARQGGGRGDAERVYELLKMTGLNFELSENIGKELWLKFVWILAFAGVTTRFNSPIGAIVDSSDGWQSFLAFVKEGVALASSHGVQFSEVDIQAIISKGERYRSEGREASSSLALDVAMNRRTEYIVLHKEALKLAEEKKVSTPMIAEFCSWFEESNASLI